jgi:hypothetical protein
VGQRHPDLSHLVSAGQSLWWDSGTGGTAPAHGHPSLARLRRDEYPQGGPQGDFRVRGDGRRRTRGWPPRVASPSRRVCVPRTRIGPAESGGLRPGVKGAARNAAAEDKGDDAAWLGMDSSSSGTPPGGSQWPLSRRCTSRARPAASTMMPATLTECFRSELHVMAGSPPSSGVATRGRMYRMYRAAWGCSAWPVDLSARVFRRPVHTARRPAPCRWPPSHGQRCRRSGLPRAHADRVEAATP